MAHTIEELLKYKNDNELASVRLECESSSGGKHWTISNIDYVNKKIDIEYGAFRKAPNSYVYELDQFLPKIKEKIKKGYVISSYELKSKTSKKSEKLKEEIKTKKSKIEDSRPLIDKIDEIF